KRSTTTATAVATPCRPSATSTCTCSGSAPTSSRPAPTATCCALGRESQRATKPPLVRTRGDHATDACGCCGCWRWLTQRPAVAKRGHGAEIGHAALYAGLVTAPAMTLVEAPS